jgi:hypothetical protein
MTDRYTGPPMDLGNMRQNGVRALSVDCLACGHRADINVDAYPDHFSVPSFASRMKCSKCNSRNISVRPAWSAMQIHIPKP